MGGMACNSTNSSLHDIPPFSDRFSFPSTHNCQASIGMFSPSTAFSYIRRTYEKGDQEYAWVGIASKLHQKQLSHHPHHHDHYAIDCHGLDGTFASRHFTSISSSVAIFTFEKKPGCDPVFIGGLSFFIMSCFVLLLYPSGGSLSAFSHDHSI
jgi:hypothetical protein